MTLDTLKGSLATNNPQWHHLNEDYMIVSREDVKALVAVAEAADVLVDWASLSYSKDPEYWIGVALNEYDRLKDALSTLHNNDASNSGEAV
jgi:hypothetical protein